MSKHFLPALIILLLLTGSYFAAVSLFGKSSIPGQVPNLTYNSDKKAILTKVQELKRIETVVQDVQRDFDLNVDFGDYKIFSIKIENKKDLSFQVSGSVIAGIDTAKITEKDLAVEGSNLTISLPAPEIFSTQIDPDKLAILDSKSTTLFKLQNLSDDKSRESDQIIKQNAIKQAQNYLASGACELKILDIANTNAVQIITEQYTQKGFFVIVKTTTPPACETLNIPKI